jgi:hypothetical protein
MTLDPLKATFSLVILMIAILPNATLGKDFKAVLVRGALPSEDAAFIDALKRSVISAGYEVTCLSSTQLVDSPNLDADLLVLSDSSTIPAKSASTIEKFLRKGKNIIALNTPLWHSPTIRWGDRWVTTEKYEVAKANQLPEHVLFDFKNVDLSSLQESNHPDDTASYRKVPDGPGGSYALHAIVDNHQGWNTLLSPDLKNPFPEGHTLTVFAAKGSSRTCQLEIEWMENDGSRWIAVIPLSTQWRWYVLQPSDFKYWPSNPNRGGKGDSFQPQNAKRLSFGLAFSHTGAIGGRHEYWIGPIGTSKLTSEYAEYLQARSIPALDILSPEYKFFEITNAVTIQARADQFLASIGRLSLPKSMYSPHPRPRGAGFSKGALWRWIPLIDAKTKTGEWCGSPVSLLIHFEGPFKGGIWASFSIKDKNWYKTTGALKAIQEIASRMKNGIFLVDGGTNYYTYFEDQSIKAGLEAINLGMHHTTNMRGRIRLFDAVTKHTVFEREWTFDLEPGKRQSNFDTWHPPAWPSNGFRVTAELIKDGKIIDQVSHEVHVWRPKKEREFVVVKNGDFILNGKRWRPHGVNYMPSSGIGTEDAEYFEHWLGARSYDPEVIERDLKRIKDIGFNSVSIFLDRRYMESQNLLDFLRRLEKLGLKANLSLRPSMPMDHERQWPEIKPIIEYYRLRENDTIFAYDLTWEPMWGKHEDRKRWDSLWEKWVIEQYGSIENAEKDWGFPIPRDANGKVTNPSSEQIERDGEWRRMVSAYRRFLDILVYKEYSAARRRVKSIDPNHLVSFRMANAGDPTMRWEGRLAYDWPYLAGAVDILEPEAYGRIGDWERVKAGWFEFEYARACAPHLPMIWAEMGCNIWVSAQNKPVPETLAYQAQFYKDFYKMMIYSGADGIFFWWYPGGFRVGENSDFGIINPDGSDRPVTKIIREYGPRFVKGPDAKKIDYWIEIDRDKRAEGIVGIYDEVQEEFWTAIANGHAPGLKLAGTGLKSTNCPRVAVGNTQWTGNNPSKYLDGVFDLVEVQDETGSWIEVKNRETVEVSPTTPIKVRLTLTNLGMAQWISPNKEEGTGTIFVKVAGVNETFRYPLPSNVDHLESIILEGINIPTQTSHIVNEITLSLEADGIGRFGEVFRLKLATKYTKETSN